MPRRLTIRPSKNPVMTVHRRATRAQRLVYVICAPKPQKYTTGRSRIIYIGTTKVGVRRVAASMAGKAMTFLSQWGVKSLDVYTLTCPPRPGTHSWRVLERDLLIAFKIAHGRVPLANTSGKNFTPEKLSRVFQSRRLAQVLTGYSA